MPRSYVETGPGWWYRRSTLCVSWYCFGSMKIQIRAVVQPCKQCHVGAAANGDREAEVRHLATVSLRGRGARPMAGTCCRSMATI